MDWALYELELGYSAFFAEHARIFFLANDNRYSRLRSTNLIAIASYQG
jgi:hypothetical protein